MKVNLMLLLMFCPLQLSSQKNTQSNLQKSLEEPLQSFMALQVMFVLKEVMIVRHFSFIRIFNALKCN